MTCIHTGADVWLEQYDCFIHCDAFEFGDTLVLRTCPSRIYASRNTALRHITVREVAQWFDESHHPGTLVSTNYQIHPYEGVCS